MFVGLINFKILTGKFNISYAKNSGYWNAACSMPKWFNKFLTLFLQPTQASNTNNFKTMDNFQKD
jgi:hypothetical protein